jgi:DNA modification methylase
MSVIPYYDDGSVTIYHGDCRDVLPQLPACDLVLSDPPYGIGYKHGLRKGGIAYGNDGVTICGDDEPFDPSHVLSLAPKVALWGGNHFADRLPSAPGWLVWDKRDGDGSSHQSDCEMAWTNWMTVARLFSARWRGGMREGREQREGRMHINQKPVALMAWCIRLGGDNCDRILDPYMGSGSTLRAAKDLGRRAVGIEVEERYCQIAAERCAQEVLGMGEMGEEQR